MKILIIRYSSLGDLVLLTAATAAIKKLLPEAEIH
ncbi:MAG: glycosyltransferase family 9 protein, partial [Elusimicrobia bacterium]|nr:glycosyltransferase family 9 protein [Elusimicrobiota bacterium]